MPAVAYVGLYPKSLAQYIARAKSADTKNLLAAVFRGRIKIDDEPQSVALEAGKKLIFAYGQGRTVDLLFKGSNFKTYVQEIAQQVDGFKHGTAVVAIGVPFPLQDGVRLLQNLRGEFHDRLKVFIGTSSLRKTGGALDIPETQRVFELLKLADIVSFNEVELNDLHTAVVGQGVHADLSLANKLKDLPLRAIKVCHSADGAILDIGCDPGEIIQSEAFKKDPYRYLKEALQLSVDGAAYALDSSGVGSEANASMIKIYSDSIKDRTSEVFRVTFLKTLERMPGGIVGVEAPLILQRRNVLTGVGAMFDGLLLSYLMQD